MGLDGLIPHVETGNSGSEIEACEHHVDQILIKVNEVRLCCLLSIVPQFCFSRFLHHIYICMLSFVVSGKLGFRWANLIFLNPYSWRKGLTRSSNSITIKVRSNRPSPKEAHSARTKGRLTVSRSCNRMVVAVGKPLQRRECNSSSVSLV